MNVDCELSSWDWSVSLSPKYCGLKPHPKKLNSLEDFMPKLDHRLLLLASAASSDYHSPIVV